MKPIIGISTNIIEENGRYYQQLAVDYVKLVESNGMIPFILPFTEKNNYPEETLARVDGVIISGGEDIHPRFYGEIPGENLNLTPDKRVEYDFKLVNECLTADKPLMAICYGLQLLNVARGGTLYQNLSLVDGIQSHQHGVHAITMEKGSKLYSFLGGKSVEVNTSHHQAIKKPGKQLKVVAVSKDGIIEAVEYQDNHFVLGVQWHPERKRGCSSTLKIMDAFRQACLKNF